MPADRKPELSVTGLIAGAGATITATVAASYFGVGGTLIGAGAVSVLSTVGASVYQHFLDRGKAQLAAKMPVRAGGGPDERPRTDPARAEPSARPWPKWYVLAGAATGVFLAVMGLVTAFELVTGRPLSNTVRGRAGGGTSVHPARVRVRETPEPPPVTRHATPAATPSARATQASTPSSEVATAAPAPRPSPSEASAGPPVVRSPGPPEAPPPPSDDAWRTP